MKEGFEKIFSGLQADMVSICLEYIEKKANRIYIYASYESKMLSCDYFFDINGKICKKNELPAGYNADVNRQMSCLDIMLDDMEKLIDACKEYEAEMPTEIKLIYDVKTNKLNANYQYDEMYSKTELSADDMVEAWYKEICESL